ncbi:hypothetical protein PG996_002726 [Apiospora saccharicola]|uniref:PHD-type domain-containing protein n=1 Tax=Apiospora saccharicola TaxID=335842 RepID=A0ABR1WN87_9PEZI
MCYIQVDQWNCGLCGKFLDQAPRNNTWITCDVGPTYEEACPNFYAQPMPNRDFWCKDCRRASGRGDSYRRLTTEKRP